jgi:hypothetical protein
VSATCHPEPEVRGHLIHSDPGLFQHRTWRQARAEAGLGLSAPVHDLREIGPILRHDRRWLSLAGNQDRYGGAMSARPTSDHGPHEPYEVIHLGGEAAAIVPLSDLRRLRAVERRASPEVLEEAEIEATLTAHREWVAAGRPGAVSHEEAMAELLSQ